MEGKAFGRVFIQMEINLNFVYEKEMSSFPYFQDVHYDASKQQVIEPLSLVTLVPNPANPGPSNDLWINSTTGHVNRGTFDLETGGGVLTNAVQQAVPGVEDSDMVAVYEGPTGLFVKNSGALMKGIPNANPLLSSLYTMTADIPTPGGVGNVVYGGGDNITNNTDCVYLGNAGVPSETDTMRLGNSQLSKAFVYGVTAVLPVGTNDILTINQASQQVAQIPFYDQTFATTFSGHDSNNNATGDVTPNVNIHLTRVGNSVVLSVDPTLYTLSSTSNAYFITSAPLPSQFIPSLGRMGVARTGQSGPSPFINPEVGQCLVDVSGLITISRSADINEAPAPATTFTVNREPWWGAGVSYHL
jgi:hypothetical protein